MIGMQRKQCLNVVDGKVFSTSVNLIVMVGLHAEQMSHDFG